MQEIKIKCGGREYTLNDNGDKYNRARKDAGQNAGNLQVLAHYDKLAGFIKDEHGDKIENGLFWGEEKSRLAKKQTRKENWKWIEKITSHPVIAALLIVAVFAIVWYFFGVDLSRFN